ncbi:hypothetical protein AALA98_16070 [Lachnospiraceae bacterium 45-W7]
MKKEDFESLGISGELAEASQKELEAFNPKVKFEEVNEAKIRLREML